MVGVVTQGGADRASQWFSVLLVLCGFGRWPWCSTLACLSSLGECASLVC